MILGYVRVSTEDQINGTSPDEQENVIRGYAMTQGATKFDIQIYSDMGVSAAEPLRTRPEGSRLLKDAQPGDTVVASKLDRMFRSALDALTVVDYCVANKINLVLFDMGSQPVTGEGISRVFLTMLAAFAEFERGRIRDRMIQGKAAKEAKGGFNGGVGAVYGYRVVGEGKQAMLEENPDEQMVLGWIRDEAQKPSFTNHRMTRILKERGVKNRVGKTFRAFEVQRIAERVRAQ